MLKPWANFGLNVLYIFAFAIAVIGFFSNIEDFGPTYREYRKHHSIILSFLKAVIKVYGKFLLAIAVTAIVAMIVYRYGTIKERQSPATTPTLTPIIELTPTISGIRETGLDDYPILNMKPDAAFVFHEWTRMYPIKVNYIEYEDSIGVRIPVEDKENYKKNHDTEREIFQAEIEYSLAYQFDVFQFQYGIDDNTFLEGGLCPPQCHFWIVVESCSSSANPDGKLVELYRTPEMNYRRTLEFSDPIDVSDVETLRLTIFWKFDVIQSKPLAFNVAIVNPTLFTEEN
ncbi:MAG: hypothetical protein C0413_03085 [Clostridiales bacterium]|nr:hypothetical protein [Clostridiales bacterium]